MAARYWTRAIVIAIWRSLWNYFIWLQVLLRLSNQINTIFLLSILTLPSLSPGTSQYFEGINDQSIPGENVHIA